MVPVPLGGFTAYQSSTRLSALVFLAKKLSGVLPQVMEVMVAGFTELLFEVAATMRTQLRQVPEPLTW
jgi:hypothetical protein